MKKIILLPGILCICSAIWAQQDSRSDFFGTWHLEETNMFYTISNDRLIGFSSDDNTGFTVLISSWEIVVNMQENADVFPNGFIITGTMETKEGSWWIGIGDSDIWTWFMSIDKKSMLDNDSYPDVYVYKKIR